MAELAAAQRLLTSSTEAESWPFLVALKAHCIFMCGIAQALLASARWAPRPRAGERRYRARSPLVCTGAAGNAGR